MKGINQLKRRIFWIRLLHWEYWSFHIIYLPVYPIWLFLCLRARSLFFFAAANPRIAYGGFLSESKKLLFDLIPPGLQPRTLFFSAGADPEEILDRLRDHAFRFPLIAKPDIGSRGRAVRKLDGEPALRIYASCSVMDFHIQEFVSYEKEIGIFYYRFPGQPRGCISGMVGKELLSVTGDGRETVAGLLLRNPRAVLQLPELMKNHPELLQQIPGAGEVRPVAPYGNHARGAKFLDDSHRLTPALGEMIDALCRQIPDFHYGRLDIRCRNQELLEAGRDFALLEVNGAGSEPTHMYDPRHSLFFAWKEIVRHWFILFRISRANHRRGHPYLSFSEGLRMFREDKQYAKQLSLMKTLQ